MWIVKLALRRPYTFAVVAIAILIAGFASFRQTPKDIFPEIDIPVISVIWTYNGLSVEEFERQITGKADHGLFRVRPLGKRQRRGTHRIANFKWGWDHQTVFPSGRESGTWPCSGDSNQSGDSAAYATWGAAAHHSAIRS